MDEVTDRHPIEKATLDNLVELTNLVLELWPDCTFNEEYQHFKDILTSNKAGCFLFKVDHTYIGFIYMSLRTDYVEGAQTKLVAYVEGIYIKPEFQRKGFGSQLLQIGLEWAKGHGCIEIGSDTSIQNQKSQLFHQKLGFTEMNRTVNFLKRIDHGDDRD